MKIEKINCIIAAAGKSSRFDIRDDKILFSIKNRVLIEHIFLKIKPFSNKVIIICNIDNIEKITPDFIIHILFSLNFFYY